MECLNELYIEILNGLKSIKLRNYNNSPYTDEMHWVTQVGLLMRSVYSILKIYQVCFLKSQKRKFRKFSNPVK